MRIVTAKEFLQLKPPVFFQKYNAVGLMGSLCLKYENSPITDDFYFVDYGGLDILVNGNELLDSNEEIEFLIKAEETGIPFERDYECGQRDSLFDMEQKYVVYDENDIKQLIQALQSVIKE